MFKSVDGVGGRIRCANLVGRAPCLLLLAELTTACQSQAGQAAEAAGPLDDGEIADAALGVDPFGADSPNADPMADSTSSTCDDSTGDLSACTTLGDSGADATCLTPALCSLLTEYLSARTAGFAMSCVSSFASDCTNEDIAACFFTSARQSCAPAEAGTPPCSALAAICSSGDASSDPFGAMGACLSMATALQPAAVGTIQACLRDSGVCDPDSLASCSTGLFP
jgi:hypothetical protein